MTTPEGYEKDDIKKYLKNVGAYFLLPATFGFGSSGHSDIVGCLRGRFFSIEVKREGKDPTALQELRMAEVKAAGGIALWGTAQKVIAEFNAIFP